MSPTVLRYKGYRFFFFSREEPRMHVHVFCADGEAKYWLEPTVQLSVQHGLSTKQLSEVESVILENRDVIISAWNRHFTR